MRPHGKLRLDRGKKRTDRCPEMRDNKCAPKRGTCIKSLTILEPQLAIDVIQFSSSSTSARFYIHSVFGGTTSHILCLSCITKQVSDTSITQLRELEREGVSAIRTRTFFFQTHCTLHSADRSSATLAWSKEKLVAYGALTVINSLHNPDLTETIKTGPKSRQHGRYEKTDSAVQRSPV